MYISLSIYIYIYIIIHIIICLHLFRRLELGAGGHHLGQDLRRDLSLFCCIFINRFPLV